MSDEDKSQKTEAPSKRKLDRAREEGQVAKSQDLGGATTLFTAVLMASFLMPYIGSRLVKFLLNSTTDFPVGDISIEFFRFSVVELVKNFIVISVPLFAVIWLATAIVMAFQVGIKISFKVLEPKLEKINPVKGFQRLFSKRSVVSTVLALIKMVAVAAVVATVFIANRDRLFAISFQETGMILGVLGDLAFDIGIKAAGTLLLISLVDLAYQKWQFLEDQKMTKHEVKEEYKQQEGNPTIKSHMRAKQKSAASKRGLKETVKEADVVITNPYHIAVAVKYDRTKPLAAPTVVAKGARLLAQRIKDFAKEYKVDVIRNIPLARGLYKECKVDAEIPEEFYVAVAEVLAVVYSKKRQSNN